MNKKKLNDNQKDKDFKNSKDNFNSKNDSDLKDSQDYKNFEDSEDIKKQKELNTEIKKISDIKDILDKKETLNNKKILEDELKSENIIKNQFNNNQNNQDNNINNKINNKKNNIEVENFESEKKYDSSSISVLEGVEAIRKYPGMYIGDVSNPNHLFYETMDNSVDEAIMGFCDNILVHILSADTILLKDNGRGIPIDKHQDIGILACELVFTKIHAGGKFDTNSYKKSGGLHGVGLTAVNALCENLKVTINRDNKKCIMKFLRGILISTDIMQKNEEDYNGTEIILKADKLIFDSPNFDIEKIVDRLKYITALNRNLKIDYKNELTQEEYIIKNEKGIETLIIEKNKNPLLLENISICEFKDGLEIEAFLNWEKDAKDEIFISFTNCIIQTDHGSHVNGIKLGILLFLEELKEFIDLPEKVSWSDVKSGIRCVLNLKIQSPKFDSQSKNRLVSNDVRKKVESITSKKLKDINRNDYGLIQPIIEQIKNSILSKIVKRKDEFHLNAFMHEGRLIDCRDQNPENRELFIVEGESAGGSIKQCRDKNTQAILTLRGKILNIEKANLKQIINSETLSIIASSLGGQYMQNGTVKIDKIKYNKIIILVDADVDGSHIRSLLLNLFYRHIPEIIYNNYVYIVTPPLYRVQTKSTSIYFNKSEELIIFITDYLISKYLKEIEITEDKKEIFNFIIKNFNEKVEISNNEYLMVFIDIVIKLKLKNYEDILKNYEKIRSDIKFNYFSTDCYLNEQQEFILEDFISLKKLIIDKNMFNKLINPFCNKIFSFGIKCIEKINQDIIEKYNSRLVKKIHDCYIKINNELIIQRFKGLGEMNPEQLFETSMDIQKRKLKQITINDAIKANLISTILMGDDPDKRRKFISENYDIDINRKNE